MKLKVRVFPSQISDLSPRDLLSKVYSRKLLKKLLQIKYQVSVLVLKIKMPKMGQEACLDEKLEKNKNM